MGQVMIGEQWQALQHALVQALAEHPIALHLSVLLLSKTTGCVVAVVVVAAAVGAVVGGAPAQ